MSQYSFDSQEEANYWMESPPEEVPPEEPKTPLSKNQAILQQLYNWIEMQKLQDMEIDPPSRFFGSSAHKVKNSDKTQAHNLALTKIQEKIKEMEK